MKPENWTLPLLCVEAVRTADVDTARAVSQRLSASGQLRIVPMPMDEVGLDDGGSQVSHAEADSNPMERTAERSKTSRRRARGTQPWRLLVDGERRIVVRPDGARSAPDFTDAATRRRTATLGPASEPVLRALGISSLMRRLGRYPTVVDATAGYGTDSWLAAAVGCQVHMLERSALMVELLTQALRRAGTTPATSDTAARVSLSQIEATEWLHSRPAPVADVIYLDPMFPARSKSAKVTKGMQFLHELLPDTSSIRWPETEPVDLLHAALARAAWRVVVKRPRGAARLDEAPRADSAGCHAQVTTIESPGLRHDVYHLNTAARFR